MECSIDRVHEKNMMNSTRREEGWKASTNSVDHCVGVCGWGGGILRKHHIHLESQGEDEQGSTKFIRRVSKLHMNESSSMTERPRM